MRRLLLTTSLLLAATACSNPCASIEGPWTGEFWGDTLEGELLLDFTADPADKSSAIIEGTWLPVGYEEDEPNVQGRYECPGEGQLLGLVMDWSPTAAGEDPEDVYGQLVGYFSTNREGGGTWDADWWRGADPAWTGHHEGDWTARRN